MEKIMKSNEFIKEQKKNFPIKKDGKTYWVSRSIAVLGLVIAERGDEHYILVNKRGEGCPDFQGMWNIPCGYLDYNETTKEAVSREIWEECGVRIEPSAFVLHSINDDPNEGKLQNVTIRYVARVPESVMDIPLNNGNSETDEVDGIMWMNVNDIENYDWAFNHRFLLRNILTSFNFFPRVSK